MLFLKRMRFRRLLGIISLSVAAAIIPVTSASAAAGGVTPPKAYYLALGDSLAYGYQQAKFLSEFPNVVPSTFNTGYVDDFAAMMAPLSEGMQVINDGCPGETSGSMMGGNPAGTCANGHFPYVFLHHPYSGGSQLADALTFLRAHPRQTSPVTIDIGANDLLGTVSACAGDPTCLATQIPLTIAHVAGNLDTVLTDIRAVAPTTEIIVMGIYNPNFTLPGSDALVDGPNSFNAAEAAIAAKDGAFFADPFPVINGNEPTSVCTQIAVCLPGHDIHPFDNGYAAIAGVIWTASGYGGLS